MLEEATNIVINFQEEEGKNLEKVIVEYLEEMKRIVDEISQHADKMKDTYRELINNNLNSLLTDFTNIDEKKEWKWKLLCYLKDQT